MNAMKVLVTYFSQTGNTEKIAQTIHDEVSKGHEAALKRIDEVKSASLNAYDLVFLGSPVHMDDLASPLREFLRSFPRLSGLKVAGFVTHSSAGRFALEECLESLAAIGQDKGFTVMSCYGCRCRLSPEIQPFVRQGLNVADEQWEEQMKAIGEHPNAEDKQRARQFAREVLAKV